MKLKAKKPESGTVPEHASMCIIPAAVLSVHKHWPHAMQAANYAATEIELIDEPIKEALHDS